MEVERKRKYQQEIDIECKICLMSLIEDGNSENYVIPLDTCEHVFHKDCLKNYLETYVIN